MFIYHYDKDRKFIGVSEIERVASNDEPSPTPAPVTVIAPPGYNNKLQDCTFDPGLQQWILTDIPQPEPPVEPDPQPAPQIIVSPRQLRQALTAANLRSPVEAAVSASNQDIQDWWEFATSFEENHPQIIAMCIVLNINDEQRHDVFVAAQGL